MRPILDRQADFAGLLADGADKGFEALRRPEGSGRPLGAADFVADLERVLGRPIARRAPGRKPRAAEAAQLDMGQ